MKEVFNDNHPYIKELYKKYNRDNFEHYIDLKNYLLIYKDGRKEFYINKNNSNLILRKTKNFLFNKDSFELLYSKDGSPRGKLQYYKNIPNYFIYNNFNSHGIESIRWCVKNVIQTYNADGPSAIHYYSDGKFMELEWRNKKCLKSNVGFPASLMRTNTSANFVEFYYINGYIVDRKELRNMIDNVKSGKIKKNINRYSLVNKLQMYREIAEYYNLIDVIETIDNRLLVFKLEGKYRGQL